MSKKANQKLLADLMMDVLATVKKVYPFYRWHVTTVADGSMIDIRPVGDGLSGRHAFRFRVEDLKPTTGRDRLLINGAGEFLERYNMKRDKATQATEIKLPRNQRGEFVAPS